MQEIIPFLTVFSLGAMVGLMVYVIVVNYKTWLGRACIGMCLTFGIWAVSNFNMITMDSQAARIVWFQVSSLGWAFYPAAFLLFAMEVSKRGTLRGRRILLIGTGTIGLSFVIAITVRPHLFIGRFEHTRFGWGMTKPIDSPILVACLAYLAVTGFLQMLWLYQWRQRTTYRQERHQATLLILAGSFVLLTSIVTDIILPLANVAAVPMTPIMSLAWFIMMFNSAFRYHLLDILPAVAVGEMMTRIRDLMILLNRDGSVIQMNASARATLGFGMTEQLGLPLEQILPHVDLPKTDVRLETEAEMVSSRGERIPVQLFISPRYNDFNDLIGFIVTASDLRTHLALEQQSAEHKKMETRFDDQSGIYKTILDQVKTGFLHFGADQIIQPEFSKKCVELFGRDDFAGNDFSDTLLTGWDASEKSHIRTIVDSIFQETRPWRLEVLMNMLPMHLDGNGRLVELEYRLIEPDPNGGSRYMLVIVDDRTENARQETRLNLENTRLSMAVSVLTNRVAFFELLDEYRTYFSLLAESWKEPPEHPREVMYDLYRNVHTFKGGFSRFGLKKTAEHLSQFEELLSGMLTREVMIADLRIIMRQGDPDTWLFSDLNMLKTSIGTNFLHTRNITELDQSVLEGIAVDLEQQVRLSGMSPDAIRKVLRRFRELYSVQAKQMLQDYESYVKVISHERNLPEPYFSVQGSDILLDGKLYRPFFRALVHIFNNIVSHAIEPPEERIALGKPERASIECRVERKQDSMLIEITDDGCGIDTERIRKEMRIRTGMTLEASEAVDEEDLYQYIFEPGYSMALRADFLSGRGIGLFAVAHAAHQLGGTVRVHSRQGVFTRFSFVLAIRRKPPGPVAELHVEHVAVTDPEEAVFGGMNGGAG